MITEKKVKPTKHHKNTKIIKSQSILRAHKADTFIWDWRRTIMWFCLEKWSWTKGYVTNVSIQSHLNLNTLKGFGDFLKIHTWLNKQQFSNYTSRTNLSYHRDEGRGELDISFWLESFISLKKPSFPKHLNSNHRALCCRSFYAVWEPPPLLQQPEWLPGCSQKKQKAEKQKRRETIGSLPQRP